MKFRNMMAASGVLAGVLLSPLAQASYSLVDLGDLAGGTDSSTALSINDSGVVVGIGREAGGQRAVAWANGSIANMSDATTGTAYAINNRGTVVGTTTSGATTLGFVQQSGGARTSIGDLAGGANYSFAGAVNTAGTVVGYSSGFINGTSGASTMRAVSWSNGALTQLGSLNDATSFSARSSYAYDINSTGLIVGYSSAGTSSHAVEWANGSMTDLGVLSGTTSSKAYAINSSGTIAGVSGTSAVIWQSGSIVALTSFAGVTGQVTAYDINDFGAVVGQAKVDGGYAGFMWTAAGGMVNLNTLLSGDYLGWSVTDARSINDSGVIAATATLNGISHAVTLQVSAVPEPESWAMLLAGLAGLTFVSRRKRARPA
jgi:probable HAF family extracellular repeat protein